MVGYGSTMGYGYASSGCCGGSYYGGSMYSPGMMGGYGSSMYYPGGSYAYGQQMYYPGGTSGYGQPMYYGGLQQAGYAPGYGNPGLMPAGGVPGQMPGATAETRSVKISDSGFDPKELTVTPGTTVHWTNSSSKAFTVTSDKGDWDSGDIQPGRDFTATFTKPGTFDYHCKNHPDMKGTVVVK
jgi:plastocyanin